uniref:Uncharacterized protein n=1 Tax=Panagrolaimus davidi TaxID=227884 RepID=A0A914R1P3_9BILA
MVLRLLTPYTKEFEFRDSHCVPNINFSDIIKNAPNIEYIDIYDWDTNIQIDKTWPEDLLKYKKGKNFRNLSLKFGVIEEFNIEKLKEFIRTKCTSDITIYVRYDQNLDLDDEDQVEWEKMDKIIDKLNQYFDDTNESSGDAHIWIGFDGVDGYHTIPLENYITPKVMPPKVKPPRVMSTRVMPSRAATKRRYV